MKEIEELLQLKGVRPTAIRMLVAQTLAAAEHPLSLNDLEARLGTVDKSSIFRALTLFEGHDVIHAFEDGSGSLKYEICPDRHAHHVDDMHAHFHCEACGRTFCLKEHPVGGIALPDGFSPRSINLVVKGLCPTCSRRHAQSGAAD